MEHKTNEKKQYKIQSTIPTMAVSYKTIQKQSENSAD